MSQTTTYLDELNDVQRQAVTTIDGPVLVVAGPGSGKTRVLTYRIAHMLHSGVAPWEILSLTFTNKAAKEMQERIEKVVGSRAKQLWAGTFHSIFSKILRIEADKIGYPNNFTIYDSEDSKSVISAIIKDSHLNREDYNTNQIRSRISSLKSSLVTPKAYANRLDLQEEDRKAKRPYFLDIYTKYVLRCKRAGAMDFDDLLFRMFELLQNHEDVRQKYQKRFRYLMVDEFQDTNTLQYAILRKLVQYENSPNNICVVGDDAQSIYAFRGATIQNILDFEADYKDHGIQVFKLEQNYRSTGHIVEAANELISNNARQIQKKIWSDKGDGQHIKLIKAQGDTEEGKRVVDTILELKSRYHLQDKDIAILYRTNAQSRIFEEYLRNHRIKYKVFGGQSFYQRKEVKDLIAYLRLSVNAADDEALKRVINYPKRAIGNTTIDKISSYADAHNLTLWDSLLLSGLTGRTAQSLMDFAKLVQTFQHKAASVDAYEAANFIARQSGLAKLLQADTTQEGVQRLENFEAVLNGIKEFVDDDTLEETEEMTQNDKQLTTYLQSIALYTDLDDTTGDENDYVTLMSVHAAKGLEYPAVFVVGLEESLFPSFMAMESQDAVDEERRLFYVAITRAQQFLTLTFSASRYRHGSMRFNESSRFLEEIDMRHIETTMGGVSASRSSLSNRSGNSPFGGPRRGAPEAPQRSGVTGVFKRESPMPQVDMGSFVPSNIDDIIPGTRVLHLKFGEGEVLNIDGVRDKRVATILFSQIDNGERRIMLKFAKLMVL